jgi:hypothetical protein
MLISASCTHTHMHTYIHTYTHTQTHTLLQRHTPASQKNKNQYLVSNIHPNARITHIHTYVHTHKYTHRPASTRLYFSIWSQTTALMKALRSKFGSVNTDDLDTKAAEIFATFDHDGSGSIGKTRGPY